MKLADWNRIVASVLEGGTPSDAESAVIAHGRTLFKGGCEVDAARLLAALENVHAIARLLCGYVAHEQFGEERKP